MLKRGLAVVCVFCLIITTMVITPVSAAENTYIYLRPDNFKNSLGTWSLFDDPAAVDGKALIGKSDRAKQNAVVASAKIDIPVDDEYYVWARGFDHSTDPGSRFFDTALGEKVLPEKTGTHGGVGYAWQLAGSVALSKGSSFFKLIDSSCYYSRVDAIVITNDKSYVPPSDIEKISGEVKKYQPDPTKTSVIDTTIPEGMAAATGSQPEISDKEIIINVDDTYAFKEGNWLISQRGYNGRTSLYTNAAPPQTVIWHPNIKSAAKVQISVWGIIDLQNIDVNDKDMTYTVHFGNGQTKIVKLDSSKFEKDGWIEIGTYDFTGIGNEYVEFTKTSEGKRENMARVSDVKFTAVSGTLNIDKNPPQKPAAPKSSQSGEVLIKAGGKGYFEAGPWPLSTVKGLDDSAARFTAVTNSIAAFHPNIVKPTKAKISVYNNPVTEYGRMPDDKALYKVVAGGKETKIVFDQTQKEGWYELGTFDFTGDAKEYVELRRTNEIKSTITRSDSVKFTPAEGETFMLGTADATRPGSIEFVSSATGSGIFDSSAMHDYDFETASYIPGTARVISQNDPNYKEEGTWAVSGLSAYQGTTSRYSFDPNAKAIWNPGKISGKVRVSIFKLQHVNSDPKAVVEVVASGKTTKFYLDFTSGTSGWVNLGIFDFDGSGNEYVSISNSETLGTCRANAVMFEDALVEVNIEKDEQGRELSNVQMDSDMFNNAVSGAAKSFAKGFKRDLKIYLKYSKDYAVYTLSKERIEFAKKILNQPGDTLTFETDKAKLTLPISEINLNDGEQLVVTLGDSLPEKKTAVENKVKTTGGQIASAVISFNVEAQKDGVKRQLIAIKDKFELQIMNTTTDNKISTSVFTLDGETLSYVPAYIDGYGAFGETLNSANGFYEQKMEQTTPPIIAVVKAACGGDYVIAEGKAADFPDMQGHWAQNDVDLMAAKDLVKGKGDGYAPEDQITRAEFATLLVRASGADMNAQVSDYSDVSQNNWFYHYVAAAKATGFFDSIPISGLFMPEQPITRQEMSVMIYNAMKYVKKYKNTLIDIEYLLKNFADNDTISDWAKEPVAKAIEAGIITGIADGGILNFMPNNNATRAQAAVMLQRFLNLDSYVGPLGEGEWELVFHDEFDGDSMDWSVWESDSFIYPHIMSSRYPENIKVEDGKVKLVALREPDPKKAPSGWTTGSVWTKTPTTYGYFEAKYKYPDCDTTNYNIAFWLFYTNTPGKLSGSYQEIDINEGRIPNMLMSGLHLQDGVNIQRKYVMFSLPDDLRTEYHTYALQWDENFIIWYFDGKEIRREPTGKATQPMYVYLSTALTKEATQAELDKDVEGSSMDVEYVRVYRRKQ